MKKLSKISLIASLLMFIVICNGYGNSNYSAIELDTLNVAELEEQAKNGNADAQVELGRLYWKGERGVKKDYAEAVKWFQKAVDKGNVYGKFLLGQCYDDGIGVEKNYTKAYTLYNEVYYELDKMAEAGDVKAQTYLGIYYLRTDFTDHLHTLDPKKLAFTAFKDAALQGYVLAYCCLGLCYEKGYGVTQSYAEAMKWYRLAAEQGRADAQYNLGLYYHYGWGCTQSDAKAVKWWRLAAEHGLAEARYNLGLSNKNGYGVTQSDAEAIKWYRLAAEQGWEPAQYNIGFCYYIGDGVTQSYTEAIKWWRLAAEQGFATAQYSLGACYHNANGVQRSELEAIKWFRKAAKQGHREAILFLKAYGITNYY